MTLNTFGSETEFKQNRYKSLVDDSKIKMGEAQAKLIALLASVGLLPGMEIIYYNCYGYIVLKYEYPEL